MNERKILLTLILIMLISLITISNGLIVNGTIGSSAVNSSNYKIVNGGGYAFGNLGTYHALTLIDIEKMPDVTSFVYWWGDETLSPVYDAGAPPTAQTTFNLHLTDNAGFSGDSPNNKTGRIIGSGIIGYNRLYDTAGNEIPYASIYILITPNTWNISGLTGTQYCYLDYNSNTLYNVSTNANTHLQTVSAYGVSGMAYFGGKLTLNYVDVGWYTFNKGASAYAYYNAEKPLGLGIQGYVNKTNGLAGTIIYPSKVFISDVNHKTLSSESVISGSPVIFNTNASQIYISLYTNVGDWQNSSLLFGTAETTPTPTPTPNNGDYSITALPAHSSYGQTITTTLYKSGAIVSSGITTVTYDYLTTYNGEYSYVPLYEVGSTIHRTQYHLKSGTWYGWDELTQDWSNSKGSSIPNPVTFVPTKTGDIIISCGVSTTGGDLFRPETTINVGGTAATKNIGVYVMDWQQGGYIAGASISVKDTASGNWTNKTGNNVGYAVFPYPSGSKIYIEGSATNYAPSGVNWEVYKDDYVTIKLYPIGTGSTNVSESLVLVKTYEDKDGSIRELSGVQVSLSDGQSAVTVNGATSFTVANTSMLTITGSMSGYASATKTVYVNAAITPISLYLISSSSTNIPTPFPTQTIAPIPTPTLAGNLTVCKDASQMPKNSTPIDIMKNNIACWGVTDLESQNLTFAAGIILICALILGKIGKGTGAAIGGLIGFILSFAAHFIPFYLVVLALIIIGAYFANKFIGR